MKHQKFGVFFLLCLFVASLGFGRVSVAYETDGISSTIAETATFYLNCTTNQAVVSSMIASENATLVHFPGGVNPTDSNLLNATTLSLTFSTGQSLLIYTFSGVDTTTAKSSADSMTPTIGTAFQTTFAYVSEGAGGGQVNVTYSGTGKSNLTQYTQSLMTSILYPNLGGVSSTFLPMSFQANALTGMFVTKDAGGFNWTYDMMVSYSTNIAAGTGNHLVDVLALLKVNSIAPSPYANSASGYGSEIIVSVVSNDTVSYVSSQPGEATPPAVGWFLVPYQPANTITAMFSFDSDPSAVSPLTFTFSGIVLPEFPSTALFVAMMLAAGVALVSMKRLRRVGIRTATNQEVSANC